MRALRFSSLVVASLASMLGVTACFDLFHDTDFPTLCAVDASAEGCAPAPVEASVDAAPPLPSNFCAWPHQKAFESAQRACAWLGACEGSTGDRAFGTCMVQALLAYDCAINPNLPVRGALHDYWDCMWRVKTCDDVEACVWRGTRPNCRASDASYTQCANDNHSGGDPSVIVTCPASAIDIAPASEETCIAQGRTCALADDGVVACNATASSKCDTDAGACEGTVRHACADGVHDEGIDCKYFGEGTCANGACQATPSADAGAGAGDDAGDAGPCDPSAPPTCNGGVATGCPSGVRETVDCAALLQRAPVACSSASATPWNVASACVVSGTCTDDACTDSDHVLSCARGASFVTSCKAYGLGPCKMQDAATGHPVAACSRP